MLESVKNRKDNISYLEIYDMEKHETTTIACFNYLIEAPNWSKDGHYLVYNSMGRLYNFDLSTKASTEIDTGYLNMCNNDHVLSPCGTEIAISHLTFEDLKSRIYRVPINGGVPTLITPMAPSFLHGWSNDKKTLIYAGGRKEKPFNIYSIPANGGKEVQLTFTDSLNDGPEFDSNDEYIWFNSVRTGLMQIYRMKADGSEQTQITFDNNYNTWFPHISPDGSKIVTLCYKKGDVDPSDHPGNKNVILRLMNPDGSNIETVVELFGGQGTINVNSWSPCSKKFAYVRYELPLL